MAFMLAVGMPDEYPYDLGGDGSDYNLGMKPTTPAEVGADAGRGKVCLEPPSCSQMTVQYTPLGANAFTQS